MRRCAGCLLTLLVVALVHGGDSSALRYIEFRDGSVLRLPLVDEEWKVTTIKPSGSIEVTRLRSTAFQSITLTSEPGFEKKRRLLSTVQQLGSDDFVERERAQAALVKQGPAIRADLETCLEFSIDLETRLRLQRILDRFAELPSAPRSVRIFDLFTIKEQTWGHLGGEGIAVLVDSQKHRISRKDVLTVSVAPPQAFVLSGSSPTSDIRRIGPREFPAGSHEESFEKTPEGRPLRIGENIEKVFISKGFTLSTSLLPPLPPSFVSVNNFQVMGKSRGLSAATHSPLWEGEITIRFCQPGRENTPAGVTYFGCYLAAVMPNGTAMTAYDVQGRQLGTIYTQNNGHDFLGITSTVPMHRIRFVPNLQLDRDYTLDDLIFSPPVIHEAFHPDKFVVQLSGGDRLLCDDVAFSKEGVRLHGMPGNLPDRTVPTDELLRVNVPAKPHGPQSSGLAAGVYAELRDGSILFAKEPTEKNTRPVFTRKPNLFQETNHLVGLWSTEYPRMFPPTKNNPPLIWNNEPRRWESISDVQFAQETVTWKHGGQDQSVAYLKLPPLWMATPSEQPLSGVWRCRTRQGEELVLSEPEKFVGRLSEEMIATWQGRPVRLLPQELTSIFRSPKQP